MSLLGDEKRNVLVSINGGEYTCIGSRPADIYAVLSFDREGIVFIDTKRVFRKHLEEKQKRKTPEGGEPRTGLTTSFTGGCASKHGGAVRKHIVIADDGTAVLTLGDGDVSRIPVLFQPASHDADVVFVLTYLALRRLAGARPVGQVVVDLSYRSPVAVGMWSAAALFAEVHGVAARFVTTLPETEYHVSPYYDAGSVRELLFADVIDAVENVKMGVPPAKPVGDPVLDGVVRDAAGLVVALNTYSLPLIHMVLSDISRRRRRFEEEVERIEEEIEKRVWEGETDEAKVEAELTGVIPDYTGIAGDRRLFMYPLYDYVITLFERLDPLLAYIASGHEQGGDASFLLGDFSRRLYHAYNVLGLNRGLYYALLHANMPWVEGGGPPGAHEFMHTISGGRRGTQGSRTERLSKEDAFRIVSENMGLNQALVVGAEEVPNGFLRGKDLRVYYDVVAVRNAYLALIRRGDE